MKLVILALLQAFTFNLSGPTGWDGHVETRARAASDPRLAGVHFTANGTPRTFTVPVAPGDYRLTLALGDADWDHPQRLEVLDASFSLFTISGDTGRGEFFDANGVKLSAADWPAKNTARTVTVKTGPLRFRLGSTNPLGESTIAYLKIEPTAPSAGAPLVSGNAIFLETSKPPAARCSGPAMAWCAPADAAKPAVPVLKNSSGTVLPDAVTITTAYWNLYFTATDDNPEAFGNVVRAELYIDGGLASAIYGNPLARSPQISWRPRTIEKGRAYKAFLRVFDASGRHTDSKALTVTRK